MIKCIQYNTGVFHCTHLIMCQNRKYGEFTKAIPVESHLPVHGIKKDSSFTISIHEIYSSVYAFTRDLFNKRKK